MASRDYITANASTGIGQSPDPVIALWKARARERAEAALHESLARDLTPLLPLWAQSDVGAGGAWPAMAPDTLRQLGFPPHLGARMSLANLRAYNEAVNREAKRQGAAALKQARAEGHARERAWIARFREARQIKDALGITAANAAADAAINRAISIEHQIVATSAESVGGLAVKLLLMRELAADDGVEGGIQHSLMLTALDDAQAMQQVIQ